MEKPLILASASPRRLELLSQIGIQATAVPADVDETVHPQEGPEALVLRLARAKAAAVQGAGELVLGADTVVVDGNTVLGKPANKADGIGMLLRLSGKEHRVMSGVCVINSGQIQVFSVSTEVTFGVISPALAHWYWETGEPLGKAGAYGIQGIGARFVAELKGSYSNVVGLPLYETAQLLTRIGMLPGSTG